MATRPGTPVSALVAAASAVVFDKDGTLFDLDARWLPYFRSFVDGVVDRFDDPALRSVLCDVLGIGVTGLLPDRPAAIDTGAHIRDLVVREVLGRGHDPAETSALVRAAMSAAQLGPLVPLGEVAGVMEHLAAGGRRLGIATSDGRQNALAELGHAGLTRLFDTMRCGDDVGPVKPDPRVLLGIAEEWGLAPSELLYVGDNGHDLRTARTAGVPFVAVLRAGQAPWPNDPGDAQVCLLDELVA